MGKHRIAQSWILLTILVLTGILFFSLWSAPHLTWDDDSNIFNNPYFRAGWWGVFWHEAYFGLFVPVTSFVWQVAYNLGDGSAWPFRVLNATLHLINVILVYFLLRGLARSWGLRWGWSVWIAVAVFAFHPLQVGAVGWISGGRDVLAGTFALTCACVYFRDTRRGTRFAATLFFLLALLAKPNVVVLPAAFAVMDALLRPKEWRRTIPVLVAWSALTIWPILMTLDAQADHLVRVDWGLRPWIMGDAYAFYLRKLVWPAPLSGNYGRNPEVVLANAHTLVPALSFAAALTFATAWAVAFNRRWLVIWIWVLLLLPVSGLVTFGYQRLSTVADHYNYLPLAAAGMAVMLATDRLSRWRASVLILGAVSLGLFYFQSWERARVWRSDESFYTDMAAISPKSYATAIGMSIVACQVQKEYDAGVRWTEVALEERPNDVSALANQAFCLLHAGNHFRVTELDYYLDKMDLREVEAKQPTAYSSLLASIGTSQIELKDYESGYQYLCEAYRVMPAEPNHARNLEIAGQMLRDHGLEPSCDPAEDGGDEDEDLGIQEIFPHAPSNDDDPTGEN